jgi:hypothetical protein
MTAEQASTTGLERRTMKVVTSPSNAKSPKDLRAGLYLGPVDGEDEAGKSDQEA